MFLNIVKNSKNQSYGCEIFGYGHTSATDDPRFKIVSQVEFLNNYISDNSKSEIFKHSPPFSEPEINAKAEEAIKKIGFETRTFFSGPVEDLAIIAAQKCLNTTGLLPSDLGAIIVGSNTGPGYPSMADHVKNGLSVLYKNSSNGQSNAMCYDITEACTVGSIAIFNGWNLITNGICDNVLVILSEKGTALANPDEWTSSNLFGDAASALLLIRSRKEDESFIFFDIDSIPYDGNLTAICKNNDNYFSQDTRKVQRFVGRTVSEFLYNSIKKAGLSAKDINHVISHQPSKKTLDFLEEYIDKEIPELTGKLHRDLVGTGNTSSVSTPALISKLITQGKIKRGDVILVTTFGAGTSIGNYAFKY
jgi:3-oxoacyl-[acyl-carrier-protein] synthase-3